MHLTTHLNSIQIVSKRSVWPMAKLQPYLNSRQNTFLFIKVNKASERPNRIIMRMGTHEEHGPHLYVTWIATSMVCMVVENRHFFSQVPNEPNVELEPRENLGTLRALSCYVNVVIILNTTSSAGSRALV